MEKCVEILENYLDYNEQLKKDYSQTAAIGEEEIEALKELLTRYKQLEEENKNYINPSKARTSYYDTEKGRYVMIEGYIPKHLVKEKIEEWDKSIKWNNADDRYYAIKILKELLREE